MRCTVMTCTVGAVNGSIVVYLLRGGEGRAVLYVGTAALRSSAREWALSRVETLRARSRVFLVYCVDAGHLALLPVHLGLPPDCCLCTSVAPSSRRRLGTLLWVHLDLSLPLATRRRGRIRLLSIVRRRSKPSLDPSDAGHWPKYIA